MTIAYADSIEGIEPRHLEGFLVGWPNPPAPETHLRLLAGSDLVVLAHDGETGAVVGFATALTDGVLSASIPLLEVLPAYQGRGIGSVLVHRLLARLDGLYMVDVMCDPELESFYARFGMVPAMGMVIRDYDRQARRGDGERSAGRMPSQRVQSGPAAPGAVGTGPSEDLDGDGEERAG